jgi:glycosyltransferase involved in cell wall biosynthesis
LIIYIVIPAHNEEDSIESTLESIINQSYLPKKVVVVNDNSTDRTSEIIAKYANKYDWLNQLNIESSVDHLPGRKVIHAFNKGLSSFDMEYDIICKFDADIIFPEHYLESIVKIFQNDPKVGIAGGLPFIKVKNEWVFENIAKKDHVRGPIKAYRKACYQEIGGLRPSIGWDSVDVLLAQYFGWKVMTDKKLHVKHLKPTGMTYHNSAEHLQGEALYKMRFSFILALIASLKSGLKRRSLASFLNSIQGFTKAKRERKEFLVNKDQGRFIRKLRWRNMRQSLF